MLELDHAAKDVEKSLTKKDTSGYSTYMLEYREYLQKKPISKEAQIAFSIYKSHRQKEILEALILSDCPDDTLNDALKIPPESVKIYKELFFDTNSFLTDLDRLEYLQDYPDEWGRELKLRAASLGYEFVLFTFANLVPKSSSQKRLIERLFMATAYKAMAMNFHGINSNTTRLAVKHAELMLRAYETLVKTNSDEGSEEFNLVALLAAEVKPEQAQVVSSEII